MRCPHCGHDNRPDAKNCEYCGGYLPEIDVNQIHLLQMRRLRRLRLNVVTNRILSIVSFITLILLFVSVFLPIITMNTTEGLIEYGGLAWYIKNGWDLLNRGLLATGPFYLSLALYVINVGVTFTFGIFALNSVIKSLRRKTGFKATQFIIVMFVSNFVYSSFMYNMYYEYYSLQNAYFETGAGYGEYLLDTARIVFFVPFMIHIIMNAIYHENSSSRLKILFASISAYFLFTCYNDFFTSTGFTDYAISERYVYGLFKYLDPASVTSNMPDQTTITLILCILFAYIALISSIVTFMKVIHDIYKRDTVNTLHFLILASCNLVGVYGLIISSVFLGENINLIPQISNVHLDLNSSLAIMFLYVSAMFTFALILFIKDRKNNYKKEYTIYNN